MHKSGDRYMRKLFMTFITAMAVLTFAACGSSPEATVAPVDTEATEQANGENEMEDNKDLTAEDFAGGIKEDNPYASLPQIVVSTPEPETEHDYAIKEQCPSSMQQPNVRVSYKAAEHVTYYSETCKMDRGVNIMLPSDYSEDKEYGVFYILHGIFGDENSMLASNNKIKEIVSNMVDQGLIEEYILVYPNMYAKDDPNMQPGFDAELVKPYDNFVNDLVNDLMPYIEANYSVKTGRENTLLAGFSMGGRESIYISLMEPDKFGYVCAISPAPGVVPAVDGFMTHEGSFKSEDEMVFTGDVRPDLLMICCGTNDSVVGKFPKSYHEIFERNGVEHTWYEITGANHDENAIKSGFYNFLNQVSYLQKNAE